MKSGQLIHRLLWLCVFCLIINQKLNGQQHWCKTTPAVEPKTGVMERPIANRSTVTIPVVFHVVWRTEAERISIAQIQSQLEVINQDFRLQNANRIQIPESFQSIAADMELEFCLAQMDPTGQSTSGIIYQRTNIDQIGGTDAVFYTALGGHDAWDTEHYLNIWVAQMPTGLAGRASFPNSSIPEEDGIIISPDRIGTGGTTTAPFDQGRTLTHELGHYFNLLHLWGAAACDSIINESQRGCCSNIFPDCPCDDLVEDTPATIERYINQCLSESDFPCGHPGMPMNFMTFSEDACMMLFTEGQKQRVWEALTGPRKGLLESQGCSMSTSNQSAQTIQEPLVYIYPNPARTLLFIKFEQPAKGSIQLYQTNGQLIWHKQANKANQISLTGLASGVYWIKVETNTIFLTKKLIIEP